MTIAKSILFFVAIVTMFVVPVGADAMKSCIELHQQGRIYNKFVMKRCALEFEKLTYEAITSFPKDTWKSK